MAAVYSRRTLRLYYECLRETITEGSTTTTLDFAYDNVGMPYSLIYSDGTTTTTYYYITNLQGDVVYLVDSSGNEVAAYDYDPYGKIISATGSVAAINPLRYRGYYYDSETGFYYLQSRYYDPEICRFINADSYASTGQGFIGFNMFAYCNNNSILCYDTEGQLPAYSVMLTDGPGRSPLNPIRGCRSGVTGYYDESFMKPKADFTAYCIPKSGIVGTFSVSAAHGDIKASEKTSQSIDMGKLEAGVAVSPNKVGYSATAYIADTSWVFTIFKNINIRIAGNIGVGAVAMGTWSGVEFGASFGIGFNVSINWGVLSTNAKEYTS